jgi:two-component system chemotaxis response regulator CheY
MKILIVDDDATTRRLLGFYLKTRGYEVAYAENGLEGLEKLGAENPNLVISNINMPYMDGIEFVKTVRAGSEHSEVPILMVTTESDPEEQDRAQSAGVNGYLVKPVTAEAVMQHIRYILKNMFTQGESPYA